MALDLDGTYVEPPADDPPSGVTVRSISVDWPAKVADVGVMYHRASGAVAREVTVRIQGDQFLPFVGAIFAIRPRKRAIAALVAMNQLQNVTAVEP